MDVLSGMEVLLSLSSEHSRLHPLKPGNPWNTAALANRADRCRGSVNPWARGGVGPLRLSGDLLIVSTSFLLLLVRHLLLEAMHLLLLASKQGFDCLIGREENRHSERCSYAQLLHGTLIFEHIVRSVGGLKKDVRERPSRWVS